MKILALITVLAVMTMGCTEMMDKYGIAHDSPVEQAIETVIEHHTGIILDFSEE